MPLPALVEIPVDPTRPHGATGWTAAAVLPAALVVAGQLYVVIPLLPEVGRDLAASSGSVGLMSSVFGLAYALGFVALGPFTDRFGSRRVILCGLVVTALATGAVAAAPTLGLVLTARAVQGFAAAAFTPAVLSYVVRRLRPDARLAVTTAIVGSALAAAIVAQLGAQLLAPALGWRGVFWISAAAILVLAGALRLVLREDDPHPAVRLLTAYRRMPHVLRDRHLVLLYLAAATLLGAFVAVYTALELAQPAPWHDHPVALAALRASALPALIAVPLLSAPLVRVPSRPRLIAAMTTAVGAAAAASVPLGAVWLGVALFVLAGALAVAAPALIAEVTRRAPGREGVGSALYSAAVFTGASLGSLLGTALAPFGFSVTALAGSAMLLAGTGSVAIALLDRPPRAAAHV